jgi:undecaprenyl diphosphate synthase
VARDELLAWIPAGDADLTLVDQLSFERLPAHVAIIMDGNGRWAAQRHLPRLGIDVLTLYAFSVENWKRPAAEIGTLMGLLKRYLRSELNTLLTHNVRFHVVGRMDELSKDVQAELTGAIDRTAANTGMQFNVALNYGGRTEILDAVKRAIGEGLRPQDITEETFAGLLYTAGQPDPDLLIRTSGEMRISNFLLWQIAYAEIYVTDTLWPDIRRRHLLEAVLAYQKRERRYGGIAPAPAVIGAK